MVELSIIVPIYNVEMYLKECLESLYKVKNINYEIILVNDGSTDNSGSIINKYLLRFPKITKIIEKENGGLSSARNAGLKIAKGKYISFIDSDDFIEPTKYLELFEKAKNNNLDITLGNNNKYKKGKIIRYKAEKKISEMPILSGEDFLKESLKKNFYKVEVWTNFYKRNFLIENNFQFKENLLHEDILFSLQTLPKAKRVKYYDIDFYYYRQRDNSISSTRKYINDQHRLYILKFILDYYKNNNIFIPRINNILIHILWEIFLAQKKVNIELIKEILIYDKRLKIKSFIKCFIMLLVSIKLKKMDIIEII